MRLPSRRVLVGAVAGLVVAVAGTSGALAATHGTGTHRDSAGAVEIGVPLAGTPDVTPSSAPSAASAASAAPSVQTLNAPAVAPLGTRISPDVLVLSPTSLTRAQVDGALKAAGKADHALLVDAATVHLGGGTTVALGVDPSTFRAWTPAGTAESDPLWQSVARGDVAVAHTVGKALAVPLGGTTTMGAGTPVAERVGAYATTSLPGVGALVDTADEAPLQLMPASALLLTATGQDPVLTAALVQAYLGKSATVTAVRVPVTNGRLQWVAPAYGPITSPFGNRPDPNHAGGTEFHQGIDIGAPLGAPIYAAADGVVQYAGPASGYGQEVVLSHAGGVTTVYGHMERILVTSGPVKAGQPIALVGAEGDATGPHLHFEVHVNDALTDPVAWLKAHGVKIDG